MDVVSRSMAVGAVFLLACGGSPSSSNTPEPTPGDGTATDGGGINGGGSMDGGTDGGGDDGGSVDSGGSADGGGDDGVPAAWSFDLSHEQKGAFMKARVMPEMKAVFVSHSAERYEGFNCKTCHGSPWQDHPKDALPKLKLKNGKFDVPADQAPFVQFMKEKVVPAMAGLFGQPPYNPETKEGFGCGGCHVVEM